MNWIEILKIAGIVLGLLFAGAFTWFVVAINNSPEGYEDEDGFHKL